MCCLVATKWLPMGRSILYSEGHALPAVGKHTTRSYYPLTSYDLAKLLARRPEIASFVQELVLSSRYRSVVPMPARDSRWGDFLANEVIYREVEAIITAGAMRRSRVALHLFAYVGLISLACDMLIGRFSNVSTSLTSLKVDHVGFLLLLLRHLRMDSEAFARVRTVSLLVDAQAIQDAALEHDVPNGYVSAACASLPQLRHLTIETPPQDPLAAMSDPTAVEQAWNPSHRLDHLDSLTLLGGVSPLHYLVLQGTLRTIKTFNLSLHERLQDTWPLSAHIVESFVRVVDHVGAPHLSSFTIETLANLRGQSIFLETIELSCEALATFLSRLPALIHVRMMGDRTFLQHAYATLPPTLKELTLAINKESFIQSQTRDNQLANSLIYWIRDRQDRHAPLLKTLVYGVYWPPMRHMPAGVFSHEQVASYYVDYLAGQCEAKKISFVPLTPGAAEMCS